VATAQDSDLPAQAGRPARLHAPAPAARGITPRARDRLVVLLALLTGATDATGFIALGGAFTSVMTGNMVLVGVSAGTGHGAALGLIITAIGGFVAGVAAGARVAGRPQPGDELWPRAVTRALAIELVLLSGYAVIWWSLGSSPAGGWLAPLLGLNAAALGLQSSAINRFGTSGLSTTYMTGTLTTMISRIATRQPLHTVALSARIVAGMIAGAAAGAGLVTYARPVAPALQLGLLVAVLVTVLLRQRIRTPS
jgi:uncharacterized membrane protein YoaK (UPF0700 family)